MANERERLCDPLSRAELERRWAAIRAEMRDEHLDALIIQGANNMAGAGGYFRWFTGISAPNSYAATVIFPRDGLMTLIGHGPFDGAEKFDGDHPSCPGVGQSLTTPSFPAISYTIAYEAEIAAREIAKSRYRSIGYVAANQISFGFGRKLGTLLGNTSFVDATDIVDPIKAVKSEEEIALLRRTAAMQDEALAKTLAHARAGMRDYEVMAYSHYVSEMMGGATGFFLGSSAPPGEPAFIRVRPDQGRTIQSGDVMFWQAENTGPGGLFVHMGRFIAFGKPPQQLVDMHGAAVEAQEFTVSLLRPGASCAEIFAEYQNYLRSCGLPEERRLHCHGQGYDVVERPLVRNDETMKIAANMNIGVHPSWVSNNTFVTVCDNFLVHSGEVERLHKTPRQIMEV